MREILARKSVRSFIDQTVETEKIEQLLHAAMAAPTAGNQREWEFIVVTDQAMLQKLANASPHSGCTAKAPLAIVGLANMKNLRAPDYWEQDLGAAMENILIEAVHIGLGGVWLGIAPLPERMKYLSDVFSLPDYVKPFAILALGYPDKEILSSDRYYPEKIHYNQY